jgi:hypothetical protein
MPAEPATTEPIERATAPDAARLRKLKLALLALGIVFSLAAFLALDYVRSAAILHRAKAATQNTCRVSDPLIHHAMKPNCAFVQRWGHDTYNYFANSLGFRDEKVREVPLIDPRPRTLLLGDSFTEGEGAWADGYVAMIAARLPQYDFLNGAGPSYSPSIHVNLVRRVLSRGYDIDEVIVFLGTFDVFNEAGLYRDIDANGAVAGPVRQHWEISRYARLRFAIARNFALTSGLIEMVERFLVNYGFYHLATDQWGDQFDMEPVAWTYRKVNETDPHPTGFAPLGLEAGLAKETQKMDLLWQELQQRRIPLSVVVYPYPSQLVHDSVESRQVEMWRAWCEGKCKRFITLFPAFFAVKASCPTLQPGCWYLSHFIFGDMHYNPTGNALVANRVVESLTETPVVKVRSAETAP